jgi:hypothetical protein
MAQHKLDMGKAWTQATGLIGANRDTIGAIAGLFFFVPAFAIAVFVPELSNPATPPPGANPDAAFEAMMAQMRAAYAANWPLLLVLTVVQFVGSMGLFALLTDRGNPTVAEALGTGLRSIPTYIAAQVIGALGAGLALGIPFGLVLAAAPVFVGVLIGFVLLVVLVYIFVKLSLAAPVIAIEGERNPIAALRRSWRLTKGNSARILIFIVLLAVVISIVAALVSGIIGLILAAFGESVATIGNGAVGALVNAVVTVIFLVVTVAIHRQLAGHTPEALAATFE